MNNTLNIGNIFSWIFGVLVMVIGTINMFWGNDAGFGIFVALLSLVYFLPVNAILKSITNYSLGGIVRIVLGIFILWAAVGVGELFEKIKLMLTAS